MDWDMDMDDVAEGFAPPTASMTDNPQKPAAATSVPPNNVENDVESTTLVANKVHIRGLDTLTTDNIKAYVRDHYGSVDRIEWIDDESANLVFGSDSVAQEALKALSAVEVADPSQLPLLEDIPAKPMASNPDINLQIRFAVLSDRKAPGAAQRSRFYLFHPEFDPEERRRRSETRNRYRDREEENRHRRDDRGRCQRDRSVEIFDAGMYDDDELALADREAKSSRRRSRSWSRDSGSRERSFARRNQEKELFPSHRLEASRSQRKRSASPMRDIDNDAGMDTETNRAGTASNRERASGLRGRLAQNNRPKELFPTKGSSVGKSHMDRVMNGADEATRLMQNGMSVSDTEREKGELLGIRGKAEQRSSNTGFAIKGAASANVKELFPSRFGGNTGKELFADKLEGRGKRRQKAEDLFS
ncbi:uncharacterized protein CTRU02_211991 [Colletotrichum truncatum]|uniref:Uncharacterized protein n=1 Tax=Colletotrichum truncatum TaxID=5467 RepID=A0ACC3YMA3_COLTU|nr:uncharacterized protein CTRU02_07400 [Colletotrichum truncatum]KAF6791638.1 hypothetical protein CTRU02_07400 [Colletotrichum truncatum]